MTGDVTAYLRAEHAADAALAAQPGYLPALAMRASILVSLHRFPEARDLARSILRRPPRLDGAGRARRRVARARRPHRPPPPPTRARAVRGRLRGPGPRRRGWPSSRATRPRRSPATAPRSPRRPTTRASRATRSASTTSRWARRSSPPATRPARGRRSRRPSRSGPDLPAALVGLAKLDAFDGELSAAIAELDTAIAAIPLPDWLARRADLLTLRGRARRRPQGRGRQGHGRGDRPARRRGRLRLRPRPVAVPLRPRPGARSRGHARPRRARHAPRRLRLRHPRLGAAQRGRRRRRRSPDAVGARRRHEGRPALVPRRADRPRQRASRRGRDLPRGALALGPALDPMSRTRAPTPWRRSDEASVRAALRGRVLALVLVPFVAAVALAHPLGNFTINHYAGIRVEPSRVLLDVVIDEAEIPTFQATQGFDLDGDGTLSPAETAAARASTCVAVGRALSLAVDGTAARLALIGPGSRSRRATAGCRRCAACAPSRLRSRRRSPPARRSRSRTASRRRGSAGAR